jgi:hypothetical protein
LQLHQLNAAHIMLLIRELQGLSTARLHEASLLLAGGEFNGAAYICGYAVELALKARICRTLNWHAFPSAASEFAGIQSLKTHDLETLLKLTGKQDFILTSQIIAWSQVSTWTPQLRYQPVGTFDAHKASKMVSAAEILVRSL